MNDHLSLAQLEAKVHEELAALSFPSRAWTTDDPSAHEVVIVGAGQSGIATSFALGRDGVPNVVIDQSARGHEGAWRASARMDHLQTTKLLNGIEGGQASLSLSSWYQAKFGRDRWNAIEHVGTSEWVAYLDWFRRVLAIDVLNDLSVGPLEWVPRDNNFKVPVTSTGAAAPRTSYIRARRIILATGLAGSGAPRMPAIVTENLDPRLFCHSCDWTDEGGVRDKRVGVLGSAASAFDCALEAVRCGAAHVDIFSRRANLAQTNPYRWAESPGFLKHHADLPDHLRWQFANKILRAGQAVPRDVYDAAMSEGNVQLHLDSQWEGLREHDGGILIETIAREATYLDYLILATGYDVDLAKRRELELLVPDIATWSDRYSPAPEHANPALGAFPYLGPGFEFQEKVPGRAPWVSRVFNFTFGSFLSNGLGGGSIAGLKYGLPRLVDGVTRQIYLEGGEETLGGLRLFLDSPTNSASPAVELLTLQPRGEVRDGNGRLECPVP